MNTILKIKNPWIINPFFYYGLMWSLALIGYELSPSQYCLELDDGLLGFLLLTILTSLFFSFAFNNRLKNKEIVIKYEKPSNFLIGALILLFSLEVLFSGGAPLISYLFKTGGIAYHKFGIPTLHVFIITISLFCVVKYSLQYLMFKQKKDFFITSVIFVYFLLIYSRGLILFSLIPIILIYFINKKIRFKNILYLTCFFVVVSWLFGVFGNLRVGSNWYDTSYIFRIAGVDADSNTWYAPTYWVLEYLTCSLRTLNFNVIEIPSANALVDFVSHFLPDFISKRIFNEGVVRAVLQLDWCTTYTMYGNSFATYGYIGMVLKFISYMIITVIAYCIKFRDYSYNIVGLCLLSTLYVFSVFSDMLMYSGYSFSLFFVIMFGKFKFRKAHF